MPKTNLEKRIARQSRQQGGMLVPILNRLLETQIGVDSEWDVEFMNRLISKQADREKIRRESYEKGETVFSPSGLATCLRRSYLSKNHKLHGLEKIELPAIEPHYYFITGDFIHLKIQFMMYRASMLWPEKILLVDTEMPVMSKHRDHGGTLDALCIIDGEPVVVDVKGLNPRSFSWVDRGEIPHTYRIQLADYMMLFNSMIKTGRWKPSEQLLEYLAQWGHDQMPQVKRGILLVENKGGPDQSHPAALTESTVVLKDNLPELRIRMEALRGYEETKEIPEAECESTRTIDFTGCPFSSYCYEEVKKREAERVKASDSREVRLASPKRRSRTRRS